VLRFNRRQAAETTLSFIERKSTRQRTTTNFVVKIFCKGRGVVCHIIAQDDNYAKLL